MKRLVALDVAKRTLLLFAIVVAASLAACGGATSSTDRSKDISTYVDKANGNICYILYSYSAMSCVHIEVPTP
jgi:uncharacterized lipoprotein YehR (DUF1307 family)